jgi:two-component system nitrogen regulation response regulator NtrX
VTPSEHIDIKYIPVINEPKMDYYSYKTLREAREQFEKDFIFKKLHENNWNISKTAEELEIERSNLHRKIKSLDIEIPEKT